MTVSTRPSEVAAAAPRAPQTAPDTRTFRPDIQALRAVAVGAVLLYHAGIPGFSGGFIGVDIFFVISGFLISGHLLAELTRTGRVRFGRFYARRIRRILPASFVVLALSVAAVVLFVPRTLAPGFLQDAIATAFYVPNIAFAVQGTDYLAATAPSPFQHYWSLGVEEQFYLFWPLLLVIFWLIGRRSKATLITMVALVTIASLALGAFLTHVSQPWAFFSLPTRAWELGLGALVALAAPLLSRLSRGGAITLAWSGLILIAGSIVILDETWPFPGLIALVPVAATAMIIAAGTAGHATWLGGAFGLRPVQSLGRISYSAYLVHWPLLIIPATIYGESERLTSWAAVAALVITIPLAWLLYRLVERPFQKAPWSIARSSKTVFAIAGATSLVVAGSAWFAAEAISRQPLDSGREVAEITIEVATDEPPVFQDFVPSNMTPSLEDATADLPAIYADGCRLDQGTVETPTHCVYGDPASTESIALFGDSHAGQWFPALEQLAISQGMRLDVYVKTSCPSVDVIMVTNGVRDTGCEQWRASVLDRLAADPPDHVVLSNFSHYEDYGTPGLDEKTWQAGMASTFGALPSSSQVTVISDTPAFPVAPTTCLAAHLNDALACSSPRADVVGVAWNQAEAANARQLGAQVVDLNNRLCDPESCGLIIGDRLLYRDAHHLGATFSKELAGPLQEALGW